MKRSEELERLVSHTMGSKITKLKPIGGFWAETAGAITLFSTGLAGIPVSTTHTITGANRWCRCHKPAFGSALGRGSTDRQGMGTHDSASAAVSAFSYWVITWFKPGA